MKPLTIADSPTIILGLQERGSAELFFNSAVLG